MWRGPDKILGVDDAGAPVKFQSRTLKAARYCARKKVDAQNVGDADWSPAPGESDTLDGMPSAAFGKTEGDGRLASGGDSNGARAAFLREQSNVRDVAGSSPPYPKTVRVPASPSPSV